MDYIFANALEILWLCLGFGFLILVIFVVRAIYIATQLMKKVNDLTDLTIHYINKPLSMIVQAEKTVTQMLERFIK